jgi:hypothetical protein
MRLSLIADDNNSSPVATTTLNDHPDKGALQEALNEIVRQAQWRLVEAPAEAAKATEDPDELRQAIALLANAPVPEKEQPKNSGSTQKA